MISERNNISACRFGEMKCEGGGDGGGCEYK